MDVSRLNVGIVGAGGIGLGYAACIAQSGQLVSIWAPRGGADALKRETITATGAIQASVKVRLAGDASELAALADVILIAVPLNGHKAVMDALLPHLSSRHLIVVSSMGSLSSLYLYEAALKRGLALCVAAFGTTALTARRQAASQVNVMTRRRSVQVSCLPLSGMARALEVCKRIFGVDVFTAESDPLASTLANTNPISHVPLALFNWTRIERAENWPQYHYMTPRVASVIEHLDRERVAVARSFGMQVRTIREHFLSSFGIECDDLAGAAEELHRRRGGPPGPTNTDTRYISEDVPFGLVFLQALAKVANVPVPVTATMIGMSRLIAGDAWADGNDLILPLLLDDESVGGLLQRVRDHN